MERRLKCGVCAAAALALVLCFGMEQKTRAMQTAGNAQTTLVIDAGHGGFDGGAVGTMTASWTNYGPEDNSTVINGTKGVLRIYDDPAHTLILEKKDGARVCYDVDAIQTNDNQTKSGVIDLFVESLKNPAVQGIDAQSVLTAMRAVFAAIESSETGRRVKTSEI